MKNFRIIIALFFLFSINIYSQTVKLKIIETTDVHGAIFPYDYGKATERNGSLAQLATLLKEERSRLDHEVILLSGGDILQGTPAVYYYNFEDTSHTHLLAQVMNYLDYDAGTVGNHDIETGHIVYDRFCKSLDFPWLAANAVSEETWDPYFKPYTIIEKKNIKIAVLGLITPWIPHWLPKKLWDGIIFEDMVETAEKWTKIIKEKEDPDLMVGLFHSGVDYEYGAADRNTPKNENASLIVAEDVPGFDLIFVGHDHTGWNKWVTNIDGDSVLILGATSSARDIASAEIEFIYNETKKKWDKNIIGNIVELKYYQPDSSFMEMFGNQFEITKEYVSKEIGEFTETISSQNAIFGPALFTDFLNSIQLEITGADISFAAPLSFNATIDSGKIYVKDMFELYRYENLLYTMDLTGGEIKDYLEYTAEKWFNVMKNVDDYLLNYRTDNEGKTLHNNNKPMLEGQYYNFDAAAGIDYVIDVSKPKGNRVTIFGMSDTSKVFDEDKIYKVALNSYRGNGGGGHLTVGSKIDKDELSERIINSTEKDFRFFIMKWIEKMKIVSPKSLNNWKIVPEDWWKEAKYRESKLLFD
ncbi:MAG: 5'-nucleotidase C-terminal domain-containing protein [Melioribacteraceae bacterium]|nr:5'-nucleotidase C-terminal domain-containing protein [Melioribacteraceae bacterium]